MDLDVFRDLRSNTRVIDAPKLFGIHLFVWACNCTGRSLALPVLGPYTLALGSLLARSLLLPSAFLWSSVNEVPSGLLTVWRHESCIQVPANDSSHGVCLRNSRASQWFFWMILALFGWNPSSCHALSLFRASSETVMRSRRNPWFSGSVA